MDRYCGQKQNPGWLWESTVNYGHSGQLFSIYASITYLDYDYHDHLKLILLQALLDYKNACSSSFIEFCPHSLKKLDYGFQAQIDRPET